jgi:hypothetical protein
VIEITPNILLRLSFVFCGIFQEVQTIDKNIRVNHRIRAKEIRVIDDNNEQLGVLTPPQAMKIAEERGLDLVEVAPTANPPVCRIMDYGKYLYQQNKKEHEARKHQKNITVKEVKFRRIRMSTITCSKESHHPLPDAGRQGEGPPSSSGAVKLCTRVSGGRSLID